MVLLRDYAQLWLRQKRSARAEPMNDFVGEYLGRLEQPRGVTAQGSQGEGGSRSSPGAMIFSWGLWGGRVP